MNSQRNMKAKLVTLPNPSSRPPHSCVVTRRRDGEMVDFGAVCEGIDPAIVIRRGHLEFVATHLLGMVPASTLEKVEARVEELEAQLNEAKAKLADAENLHSLEDRLRVEVAESYDNEEVAA